MDTIPTLVLLTVLTVHAPGGTPGVAAPPATPPAANPLAFAGRRAVFSLENMSRFEFRENTYDFDSHVDSVNDDAWLLNRFRLGLSLKPADGVAFFFQGQDSREFDSDRPDVPGQIGAEGDNPFDLRQAYVEIADPKAFPLSLSLGRQVLQYGDQRLIGSFEWNAIARTFDAAKVRWSGADGFWIDAFVSPVVVADRGGFDESDRDSVFSGVYAHLPATGPQATELNAPIRMARPAGGI